MGSRGKLLGGWLRDLGGCEASQRRCFGKSKEASNGVVFGCLRVVDGL